MYKLEEKKKRVDRLVNNFKNSDCFYIVGITGVDSAGDTFIREKSYENEIGFVVSKNSFIRLAMAQCGFNKERIEDFKKYFSGSASGIFFTNEKYSFPAKIIKEARKNGVDKIILKCAYIAGDVFCGDDKLDQLAKMKTKEELVVNIILSLRYGFDCIVSYLKKLAESESGASSENTV